MSVENHFENIKRCSWCGKSIFLKDKDTYEVRTDKLLCKGLKGACCIEAQIGKTYKIGITKKGLRVLNKLKAKEGDYHPQVFLFDILLSEQSNNKNALKELLKAKINKDELQYFTIEEVYL